MSGPATVVVADDQTVVRDGLRSLLGLYDSVRVVGVAASAEAALDLVATADPDVLLTDLRMPGIGGVEGIRRLVAGGSRTRCVALTTYDDPETVRSALLAGAVGFLNKDADADTIATAITAAAAGRSLLDTGALRALAGTGHEHVTEATSTAASGLTEREVEVLRLVARGLSNQQLARELVVSMATVKTHINHLLAKTRCRDRAALVAYAYDHRLTG